MQDGYLYEKNGAYHVRFYQTEMRDGHPIRVQTALRTVLGEDRNRRSLPRSPS
jgi:hypothetical protein